MAELGALTDEAICAVIGLRLKNERLRLNLTQAHVAREGKISLRTYKRFEATGISSLPTFVAVIRVLNRLRMLELALPSPVLLPPQETLVDRVEKLRKRARSRLPHVD